MPLDLDEHTPHVEDPDADEVSYNIDKATWGEEDSWFDWNQDPWTYPYPASNYSSWYQAFKAADFKSPYYYKSAISSVSDQTNEAYRVQWRGIFAKDYYFGSPPPNSVADLPIKADKAITTKQWPTPWGFGLNSPMSNVYTVLPGYSAAGYQPGNKWPEVSVYYYFTNFANKFGKNLYSFPMTDDWGMEVDKSKTGKPMPFVPLFMGGLGDSISYSKKDFKGGSSVSSIFMTYPNFVPLSFNYQKIVVVPVVYCAKYNDTRDYGLEWAGPFTLGEYFDGVNWDPEKGTGTAPKKDTYPMITAVRVGRVFFGEADGTHENRRTYIDGSNLGALLPDTLTLGGVPSARILKNGKYNTYSSKWGASDNADNWHPASGYVIDGGLISGMGQAFNSVKIFNMTLNTNITDLRKSYIDATQSEGSSLPLFHHNGEYEIHCVQRHTNNGDTPQGTIGMCPIWKNPTKEKVMRDVAYLGFWFADDFDTAERGFTGKDCNSSKMHIPLFDKDGLTTGKWLSGTDAAEADNAKWQDPFKSNPYEPDKTPPGPGPGPGPGPAPDPNPNPIYPSKPAFTLANKGSACYALLPDDINDIFGEIYGKEKNWWETLMDGLKFYGSDPMAAIISYRWYPFAFDPTNQATVRLGGIEVSPTLYPYFSNVTETLHTDSFTFWAGLDKNFVNSRHTVARLYLPFYGFYNLPIQNLISEELEVEFHYNVPDDLGIWVISFGNVIYDFVECSCHIDIPLSAYDAKGAALNRAMAAVNMAASLAGSIEKGIKAAAMATIGGSMAANSLESMRYEYGYDSVGSMVASEGAALGQAYDKTQLARVNQLKRGVPMAFGGGLGMASATGSLLGQWGSTIGQTTMKLSQLGINIPLHGAATPTTFLNLPMKPYVQIFRNVVIDDYKNKAAEYKLTVGHACDKWGTLKDMPSNSLLRTSGIAAMNTSGMTTDEVQELNTALQTGFFKEIK